MVENVSEVAKKEGRQEGELTEAVSSVLSLLEDYGQPTEELQEYLKKQELVTLRKWLKLAARVNSIEEFEEKIGLK